MRLAAPSAAHSPAKPDPTTSTRDTDSACHASRTGVARTPRRSPAVGAPTQRAPGAVCDDARTAPTPEGVWLVHRERTAGQMTEAHRATLAIKGAKLAIAGLTAVGAVLAAAGQAAADPVVPDPAPAPADPALAAPPPP